MAGSCHGRNQIEPDLVTAAHLLDVLQELSKPEPLFHRRELVHCREDFERETADDFWETGASVVATAAVTG